MFGAAFLYGNLALADDAQAAVDDGSARVTADIILVVADDSGDNKPGGDDSGDDKPGGEDSGGNKPGGDDSGNTEPGGEDSGDDSGNTKPGGDDNGGNGNKPGGDDSGNGNGNDSGNGNGSGDGTPGNGSNQSDNGASGDDQSGNGASGSGSSKSSSSRSASPVTGDPVAWLPMALVAVMAAAVAAFAFRRSYAAANAGRQAGAHARTTSRSVQGVHVRRASNAQAPGFGMRTVAIIAIAVLVAAAASAAWSLSARAADTEPIRIEMQKAGDGTYSGTATYYVDNDATYYREIVKLTEEAVNGFSLSDGSIVITIAPASVPADAIDSPAAVKGALTTGKPAWLVPGSAASSGHNIALKVTATAKSLEVGESYVGIATFDLTAPVYEDLKVRVAASPVAGQPLVANVENAPSEASNDFTYTWFASDDGEDWQPIPGATASTFTPADDLAGKRISVSVDCENPAWFAVLPADHSPEAAVAPAPETLQHTVTFDVGEHGEAPAAQLVDDGDFATTPAEPKAQGYVFAGWYTDEELTTPFSFTDTPITEDITLYAGWEPEPVGTYTVVHLQQRLEDDSAYDEADREVKTGEFTGDLEDIAKTYPGFTAVRFDRDNEVEGGLVLNVYYDRVSYTVTFHSEGSVFDTATVRYGDTVSAPAPNPTSTGKDFARWTTDGTAAYDFSAPVTGDLDLYARFTIKMISVTFETWGQAPKPADQSIEYGSVATQPASPAVGDGGEDGPEFQGWYKDSALTDPFDFTELMTDDTVVYASYTPSVMFVLGDKGSNVLFPVAYGASMSIDAGDGAETTATSGSAQKAVSATGYKIVGWHKAEDLSDAPVTSLSDIQENVKLYAELQANTYTVAFDANDGDATGTMAGQQFAYDEEKSLTANAFALQGYVFDGWNTEPDGTGDAYADAQAVKNLATGADGDDEITLYAQWAPATDTPYVIMHYLQTEDGTGYFLKETELLVGTTDAAVTATPKTYTGFTHNPLAAGADESGYVAADGGLVLKVYYDRETYTVTFDANGQGTAPNPVTGVRYNTNIDEPAPAPTATGYTFGGWFTDAGCTTPWDFDDDAVTGDTTLYAKWTGLDFEISFDANASDATGTTASVQATIGSSATLTANGFTRIGFTFAGWNTQADGSGASFADAASVAAASVSPTGADVTLYAQWNGLPVTYSVEHYTQDAYGSGNYTLAATDSGVAGVAGQNTAAAAKTTFAGFDCVGTDHAGNIVQVPIAGDSSTVVKVYYDVHRWTVSFETWGQAEVDDQLVPHNTVATDPAITSAADEPQFKGWYADSSFATLFGFTTPITADTTLYAKYDVNVLVDFQGKAANASFPKVLNSSFQETELSGLSVDGYDIDGYYSDASCTAAQAFPITMTEDVTIYPLLNAKNNTEYKTQYYLQSLTDQTTYVLDDTVTDTGTTDTTATATVKSYPGFTHEPTNANAVESGTIKGDGSLVLKVYYTRDTDTPYTVRHWQQNTDGTYPDVNTATATDIDNLTGTTGADTQAQAKTTYVGFTTPTVAQQKIAGDGTTVIDIKYARKTYTVTFNANGHGTAPAAQTVLHGAAAIEPSPVPTATGYDFGGWYTSANTYSTESYAFTTPVTENKTLYAKWTTKVFDVVFDVYSSMATTPPTQHVAYEGHATEPADPSKPGYNLVGWYSNIDRTNVFNFTTEAIRKAITVYGKFAPNTYTIAFDKNASDATGTMANLENVAYNEEKALTANAYERAGYEFKGWNTLASPTETDRGTAYDDGATVSMLTTTNGATVTLYAQWEANTNTRYTVEHYLQKLNGAGTDVAGTNHDSDYDHVTVDDQSLFGTTDTATAAAAITEGEYSHYTPETITQQTIKGDGTTVVKIYYNRNTYTLTYGANGGEATSVPAAETKPYGAKLTIGGSASAPTKAGSSTTYTVSYDANGGTLDQLDEDATKAVKAGEGKDYAFNGWNTDAGASGTPYAAGAEYTVKADATLYAQWSETTPQDKYVALPTPTPATNYTFLGWYTDKADASTKVGNAGEKYMPTEDVTLYALYTNNPYTITFVPNGSASFRAYTTSDFSDQAVRSYTQIVDPSQAYTIDSCKFSSPTNDPTAKFIGWNTKEDGSGRWVLDGESINRNDYSMSGAFLNRSCTLYAQWSHLAGLTAADLAANGAYTTYSQYVGDVWIPVTKSGDPTSYDTLQGYTDNYNSAVGKVLVCTLVGAGQDGANTLTFLTQCVITYGKATDTIWSSTASTDLNTWVTWNDSGARKSINSGQVYAFLPESLTRTGVVKEVEKKSAIGSNVYTSNDKFWVPSVSELGLSPVVYYWVAPTADGAQYSGCTQGAVGRLSHTNVGLDYGCYLRSQGYVTQGSTANTWLYTRLMSGSSGYAANSYQYEPGGFIIGFCL